MISNVGKDQLVKTLRARLQWLVLEAGEEEYNEEEVSTIVDTLSVLDPIELPGTYFTPEEAFKRFWRNQERMREAEARESGKIYINSLEKNGFWEEVQECEDVESGAEQSEDIKNKTEGTKRDSEVGMGSRSAGTEKDLSVETAKQSDDPTELFQKLKTEYWKNKPGEQGEVREQETSGAEQAKPALGLVYHAISDKNAAADRKASEEWDMLDDMEELEELQMLQDTMSAVSSPAEKAKSVSTDIEELLKHLELLKKSGVDLEQIKEILLEEKRKQQDMSKRGIKKVCKKRRWTKGTTRVAVAAVLVLGIGMGSAIGVYAGKGGFFHWRKNNEEKVAALVSSMDSGNMVTYLSYDKLDEVPLQYISYLWVPGKLEAKYELKQIGVYNDNKKVKAEVRYENREKKFVVFLKSTFGENIIYTDSALDGFSEIETKVYDNGVEVDYLIRENEDYTEYISRFNYLNCIYCINANIDLEELKNIVEVNIGCLYSL